MRERLPAEQFAAKWRRKKRWAHFRGGALLLVTVAAFVAWVAWRMPDLGAEWLSVLVYGALVAMPVAPLVYLAFGVTWQRSVAIRRGLLPTSTERWQVSLNSESIAIDDGTHWCSLALSEVVLVRAVRETSFDGFGMEGLQDALHLETRNGARIPLPYGTTGCSTLREALADRASWEYDTVDFSE
ncbi:MAG: hypothetical protein ACOCV2_06015 [Persicimonas sp.]